jgi:phosphosulfolactate phosphohydrolase-like enzyme
LLLLGSFLNSGAVAESFREQKDNVHLRLCGNRREVLFDDVLAAGSIIDKVCRNNPEPIMADSASCLWRPTGTTKKI